MSSLFLYQIDYNLKVNVKYGVQTLYLKDQIFCLQFSFSFFLALAERKEKKTIHHSMSITNMEVQEKHAEKMIKRTHVRRTIHHAVTICNKPSYYIYLLDGFFK